MDNYTREDQNDHEVLLHVTIPGDDFTKSYEQLLNDRGDALDIKGFRKGNVPTDIIEPQLETLILAETFERVAPYFVNAAIIKENIQPASPPEYKELKDLKKGEDVTFDVVVTIIPEFKLGDISKIKIEEDNTEVTDEEVQQSIETMYKNNADGIDKDGEMKIDDAWAKEIATSYNIEGVKTLDDLKSSLKEMMSERKKTLVEQDTSAKVIQEAVKISNIEIPEVAVKYEAQQREEAFMEDLERMDLSLEDFLKQRDVTLEQLKEMWLKDSEEALQNDSLLKVYADENKIEVSDSELSDEIKQIKQSAKAQYAMEHAGHDHESHFDETVYDDPQWQSQIKSYLVKQKAFKSLITEVLGSVPGEEEPKTPKDDKKKDKAKKKASTKKKAAKKETKGKNKEKK